MFGLSMFVVHGHSLQDAAAAANTTQLEEFTREMDEEIYYYYFCVCGLKPFSFLCIPRISIGSVLSIKLPTGI